jgi:hypothetical protein
MPDAVDLHEPRLGVVPVGPGTDRDLALEQRPGLGARATLEPQPGPVTGQPRRSIVAAEIETSRSRTSSLTFSSPTARSRSTISGRNGAMRLPAGASITAHTVRSAAITSSA